MNINELISPTGAEISEADLSKLALAIRMLENVERALGGPGSGNFGHAGRPGAVGGSSSDGGGGSSEATASAVTPAKTTLTKTPELARLIKSGADHNQIWAAMSPEEQAKVIEYQQEMIRVGPEFEQLVTAVAVEHGITQGSFEERATNTYYFGPVKSVERIAEKALKDPDYNGDLTRVSDVQRMTYVIDDPARALKIYETIKQEDHPTDMKDRIKNPTALKYRDVMCKTVLSNGLKAEVQINTKHMLDAKEGPGHELMVNISRLPVGSKEQIDLINQSSILYEGAWQKTREEFPESVGG